MRNLHAIILAAGQGTRMKSERPKVLHALCGRPMIAYALDLAASSGVRQPVVVLGHGIEAVKPHLPKEVKVVLQSKPLGTGDAVLAAKRAIGTSGDVLILYADTPLLRRLTVQKLVETHFKTASTATLLTAHLADPSGYGRILRNEGGQITSIVEEAEATTAQRALREINVGPLVCRADALFDALAAVKPSGTKKELYLTDIVSQLSQREGTKLQSTRIEEVVEALGINSRAELARATGVIRQRILDAHLHNGVTIEDPRTTYIDHGVSIGNDTVIHPCTVIQTGVTIGRRCTIGPFARLRSGVSVADDVRVGNFAELVRTKVGQRVRINHVTYLGDATVEEDVNIGAGTITANYDGHAKHPTQIGKGALIGSDTVLIAPVKIGAGAVTGAGSVVLKAHDVPAKGVVAGVPARPLDGRPEAAAADGAGKAARKPSESRPSRPPQVARARTPVKPTPRAAVKAARRKVRHATKRAVAKRTSRARPRHAPRARRAGVTRR